MATTTHTTRRPATGKELGRFRDPLVKNQDGRGAVNRSGIRNILLNVQNDGALDWRLENALALARACSAHLSCIHVTPIEAYVAFDSFGGVFVMGSVMDALDKEEALIKERIEDRLHNEDISWDYEQVTGNLIAKILGRSALADLVICGRSKHRADGAGPGIGFLGDLLHKLRTPLFIPGEEDGPCDPTGAALIAWDGSYEAANAVRASLGLLKAATEIRILQVSEQKEEAFPGTRLLEYLSRHDIHAELQVELEPVGGGDAEYVSGMIMAQARAVNAAYVVMGGYNHSRVGEYLFGGVTRTMLDSSLVPLVMAR